LVAKRLPAQLLTRINENQIALALLVPKIVEAPMIDYEAFRAAPVAHEPYPHFATPNFLPKEEVAKAIADFPRIDMGGLFLPEFAPFGPEFDKLLQELQGPEVRRIVEEKLDIDLAGRPTMVTLRSHCQAKDGRIHADAKFKLATLLLYLNEDWVDQGGKLRVLRCGTDIEDYAGEVAPLGGLPSFSRCKRTRGTATSPSSARDVMSC
jgi:SM-20-related protein